MGKPEEINRFIERIRRHPVVGFAEKNRYGLYEINKPAILVVRRKKKETGIRFDADAWAATLPLNRRKALNAMNRSRRIDLDSIKRFENLERGKDGTV